MNQRIGASGGGASRPVEVARASRPSGPDFVTSEGGTVITRRERRMNVLLWVVGTIAVLSCLPWELLFR